MRNKTATCSGVSQFLRTQSKLLFICLSIDILNDVVSKIPSILSTDIAGKNIDAHNKTATKKKKKKEKNKTFKTVK